MPDEKERHHHIDRPQYCFGFIHMAIGIICLVLSFAAVGMNRQDFDMLDEEKKGDIKYVIIGLDIACVVSSLWFFVTGIMPCRCCTSNMDSNMKKKAKILAFNIVTAAIFVPIIIGSSVAKVLLRGSGDARIVAIPALTSGFGLLEFFVALITSFYCCCYSTWGPDEFKEKEEKYSKEWTKYMNYMSKYTKNKSKDGEGEEKEKDETTDEAEREKMERKKERKERKREKKEMKMKLKENEEEKLNKEKDHDDSEKPSTSYKDVDEIKVTISNTDKEPLSHKM